MSRTERRLASTLLPLAFLAGGFLVSGCGDDSAGTVTSTGTGGTTDAADDRSCCAPGTMPRAAVEADADWGPPSAPAPSAEQLAKADIGSESVRSTVVERRARMPLPSSTSSDAR